MYHSVKFFPGLVAIKKHKVGKWYVRIGKAQNKKIVFTLNKTFVVMAKGKENPVYTDLYGHTS